MSQKTILFVDDSSFDRSLLMGALQKKMSFTGIEASTGEECLQLIEKHRIDLVLMDIVMPGALGTKILSKIREKYNAIDLPIIMVTSKGTSTDIIGCLQDGANDYITKPVNFEVAVSRITTHLKLGDLSREMSRLKEVLALDSIITTYNHEINNPLTIALGFLEMPSTSDNRTKLKAALWRIADIVKKIKAVSEQKEVEYSEYSGKNKMVKLD
jgi:DNA-binding response OmpR family regulator